MKTTTILTAFATANAMSIQYLLDAGSGTGLIGELFDLFGGKQVLSVPDAVDKNNDNVVFANTLGNVDAKDGMRLLSFNENHVEWVTEVQKWDLKREGYRFIDITDHYDEYKNARIVGSETFPSNVQFEKQIKELAQNITKDNMRKNLVELSSFHTRYYKSDYGLKSSLWLYDHISELAQGRDDITVNTFDHEWTQKSLIASIEGTQNPEDIVVVGAHQDSINLLYVFNFFLYIDYSDRCVRPI